MNNKRRSALKMKFITKALEKKFKKYPLRSQADEEDPLVIAKFFNPYGSGTWYVFEAELQEDGTYLFYGYVDLLYGEFGYFTSAELQGIDVPLKINGKTLGYGKIERDMYFEPVRFSEVKG